MCDQCVHAWYLIFYYSCSLLESRIENWEQNSYLSPQKYLNIFRYSERLIPWKAFVTLKDQVILRKTTAVYIDKSHKKRNKHYHKFYTRQHTTHTRGSSNLLQIICSSASTERFKKIDVKAKCKYIQFDIVELYLSLSKSLLQKALNNRY